MEINELPEDDDARRRVQQIQLIIDQHGADSVAWDSDSPEEFTALFEPGTLLVRSDAGGEVVDRLNRPDAFRQGVRLEDLEGNASDRDPLPVRRVVLPPAARGAERDERRVLRAYDILNGAGLNREAPVVTPNYWLHLAPGGGTKLCPATEPAETGLVAPWPAVSGTTNLGQGVKVVVVDSGWHEPAGNPQGPTPWLAGVEGEDEGNGPLLGPYAGHGTFIAGVVRCVAPATEVRVENFFHGGALLESDMVLRLRDALATQPHIINLSAGTTTLSGDPLLSFEAFWDTDLSKAANTILVAAAGNDGVSDPFWPAAFDWAVGVGSLDRSGKVSSFSNYGPSADVYALGRNLVNAFPDGVFECREAPDVGDQRVFTTGMARWSGTSFSAPVLVGLIAAEMTSSGDMDVARARDAVLARVVQRPGPAGTPIPALLPTYS